MRSRRSGNDAPGPGWVTLADHLTALRAAEVRVFEERDRRYAEVSVEREKALKIKEVADLAALQLAREIQTYKDEKANELREQIGSERGLYATKEDVKALSDKMEALVKPMAEFISGQRGQRAAGSVLWGAVIAVTGLALTVTTIYLANR